LIAQLHCKTIAFAAALPFPFWHNTLLADYFVYFRSSLAMSLSTPQSATSTSEMTPGIRSTRPSERNTLGDGVTNSTKRSLMPDFDTPGKVAKNARRTQHDLESMSLMQLASCEAKVRTPNGPPLSRRQIMHGWWPLKGVR